MSNTTKLVDRFLQIKGLDADWSIPGDLSDYIKTGLFVKSITFHPSGAGDEMIIKAGHATQATNAVAVATTGTAPELFHVKCSGTTDQRIKYFGGDKGIRMWPFIVIADCTFDIAGDARVEIELV